MQINKIQINPKINSIIAAFDSSQIGWILRAKLCELYTKVIQIIRDLLNYLKRNFRLNFEKILKFGLLKVLI